MLGCAQPRFSADPHLEDPMEDWQDPTYTDECLMWI